MNKLPDHAIAPGFFADPAYVPQLTAMGLTTLDSVFAFERLRDVKTKKMAAYRSRTCFTLPDNTVVYLKRYSRTPILRQLSNWIDHCRRECTAFYDGQHSDELSSAGISVPHTIAWGYEWKGLFEKRSFIMIRQIADAHSLEERLPDFMRDFSPAAAQQRKAFIAQVADFIRRFHATGCRHRDLYLCHLFLDVHGMLHLIDLHRVFKPRLLGERYRLKDLTQLYYSAPGRVVSRADRLRFYLCYRGKKQLTTFDKWFISRIKRKAAQIAARDRTCGRIVPFES